MARTASAPAAKPFHHGNLRAALVAAAVEIVGEQGAEALSVREAARRAQVSPGAPFRHFANRGELLRAVAEDGMTLLRSAIEAALAGCGSDHPLAQFLTLADAYIGWALAHPTHYRVLGDRAAIDFAASVQLVRDNGWIRETMLAQLAAAQAQGHLRPIATSDANLLARALGYGLARMAVDGHLGEFGVVANEEIAAIRRAMRAFLLLLAADPDRLTADLAAFGF